MSRSSEARAFGFRVEGLIRILVAADPEEVLKAMEALDIQLTEKVTAFDLVLTLLGTFIAPLGAIFTLLEDVEELATFLAQDPFAQIGPAGVPLQAQWGEFELRARTLRLQGINARDTFRRRIEKEVEEASDFIVAI